MKKAISLILTFIIILSSITALAIFTSVQNPIFDGVRFAIYFVASGKTDTEKKSFKQNMDSYNTVVEYLKNIIEEHPEESRFCFTIDDSLKDNIELLKISETEDNEIFEISQEVADALIIIDSAFKKMGYTFETIIIDNGSVCFNSIDGYSLVYSENGVESVRKIYKQHSDITVKRLQKNWYHTFTRFVW